MNEPMTADGKVFAMGMDLFYPASNNRFPIIMRTNPSRHVLCSTAEGWSIAVIPEATSSEGISNGSAIALSRFHSTLESALTALATNVNKRKNEIDEQVHKLRDEGFGLGYLAYKVGSITAQVAEGKLTYAQAEHEFTTAMTSGIMAKATTAASMPSNPVYATGDRTFTDSATSCLGITCGTPKKRREPKPQAKSVADIIG